MSSFARTALERIAGYLPRLRTDASALTPRLLLASRGEAVDDEIAFFSADGRRHVVHVHVGEAYLAANAAFYAEADLGDGMAVHAFDGLRNGPMRRSAAGALERDLAAAFSDQPEAFEPVPAPGIGTHPHAAAMVEAAREAAAGTGLSPRLNHGPCAGDEDEVAFLDAAGEPASVRATTRPGGFAVVDREAGTAGPTFAAARRAAFVEALREALPPAPAPGL
jgi:hypothetical protein